MYFQQNPGIAQVSTPEPTPQPSPISSPTRLKQQMAPVTPPISPPPTGHVFTQKAESEPAVLPEPVKPQATSVSPDPIVEPAQVEAPPQTVIATAPIYVESESETSVSIDISEELRRVAGL